MVDMNQILNGRSSQGERFVIRKMSHGAPLRYPDDNYECSRRPAQAVIGPISFDPAKNGSTMQAGYQIA